MTDDLTFPRIKTASLSKMAYQILREKIISKALAPGQRLDLDLIRTQLGISKTPLKEALKRLESEGLIAIAPRSGTFVTDPGPAEIANSFELRRALETFAAELAGQRASPAELQTLQTLVDDLRALIDSGEPEAIYDDYLALDHRFHRHLVALAGNPRLSQAHDRENTHSQMARIRYRYPARDLNTAQQEHERLVAALLAGDIDQARHEIDAHLRRAEQSLLADMGLNQAIEN